MMDEQGFRAGHTYNGVTTSGNARAHFGDNYNHYHTYAFPEESEYSNEDRTARTILESLVFDGLGRRSRELSGGRRQGFDWVLDTHVPEHTKLTPSLAADRQRAWWRAQEAGPETSQHALKTWLTDQTQTLLWVTGKPGSGKSTLLKAVQEHRNFPSLSRQWIEDNKTYIVVADHYFWMAGTPEQRSLAGMIKALLHGTMSALSSDQKLKFPKLASKQYSEALELICGDRWLSKSSNQQWSCEEARQALLRACECDLKLFFFIDGLDECDTEDQSALMQSIMELSACRNVKLLVSSRPKPVLAQKLENFPHLRLEDLTFFDMCKHVQDRLIEAESLQEARRDFRDEEPATLKLITDIAVRAEGVFLWTSLVTEALATEVRKGRTVMSLYKVLQESPNGLKEYFQERVLGRVHRSKQNLVDTASALKLLDLIRVHCLDWLEGNLVAFSLLYSSALADMSKDTNPKWYGRDEAHSLYLDTTAFLNECCGDLVQVTLNHDVPLASTVSLIHKSAFDFLQEGQLRTFLETHCVTYMNDPIFVGELDAMCVRHLMRQVRLDCAAVDHVVRRFAGTYDEKRCQDAQYLQSRRSCELLVIEQVQQFCPGHRAFLRNPHWDIDSLSKFSQSDLRQYPLVVMRMFPSMGFTGVWLDLLGDAIMDDINLPLVEHLLGLGCDFNNDLTNRDSVYWKCTVSAARSIWGEVVCRWIIGPYELNLRDAQCDTQDYKMDSRLEDEIANAALVLLEAGANPDVALCLHHNFGPATNVYSQHACCPIHLDHIIRLCMPGRWHHRLLTKLEQVSSPTARAYRFKKQKLLAVRALRAELLTYPFSLMYSLGHADCLGIFFAGFKAFMEVWHPPLRFDLVHPPDRECDHCGSMLMRQAILCLDCVDFPLLCRSCVCSLHVGPKVHALDYESAKARPVLWSIRGPHLGHCTIKLFLDPDRGLRPLESTGTVVPKIFTWYEQNAEAYDIPTFWGGGDEDNHDDHGHNENGHEGKGNDESSKDKQ